LAALPPNLAALLGSNKEGAFSIPIKAALAQLASGAVRVSFGELRQGSPHGTFLDNPNQDRSLVSLPLAQVLAAIDPALLARRPSQKTVVVPESVTSIFGKHQSFSAQTAVASPAPAVETSPSAPVPEPAVPVIPMLAEPKPVEPAPAPKTVAPATPTPAPGASHFTIRPGAPVLPTAPVKPAAPPTPGPTIKPPAASPPAPAAPKLPGGSAFARPPGAGPLPSAFAKPPGAAPLPSLSPKSAPTAPTPFAAPKPAPLPASPAAATSAPVAAAEENEFVAVALSALMTSWPAPVQQEIAQLNLTGATASLPLARLDAGMKIGRVSFTWNELSQWLQPAPAEISPLTGEAALELPLAVIAPLFLARKRPGGAQKKFSIGANIPDLFAGTVKAPEASAPAVAPAEPGRPAPAPAPSDALGEIFGQPGKSHWPPPEIVQKICALKGVAGAAMTMSDGLLLTGQMPAPVQAETVAAFLPQIFARVTQSAGEMQIGPLTSLVLTAGPAQCAIYKTGKLYLAVLGRPGEPLPEAVLERVAAELAKRNP